MNSLNFKVAVVTPYYKIEPDKLERCIKSVAQQTLKCDHIIVADGIPQTLPTGYNIMHIVLPANVGNSGSTPRGLGAQYAFAQGYDAVAFLDADNWYEPDHIEIASTVLIQSQADVIFARRQIIFPDGELLSAEDPEDSNGTHVDTNCFIFSKSAAFLASIWSMYPKEFGIGEDRLMRLIIKNYNLKNVLLNKKTVWYETNWNMHYKMNGKNPVAPLRAPTKSVSKNFDPKLFYERTGIKTNIIGKRNDDK